MALRDRGGDSHPITGTRNDREPRRRHLQTCPELIEGIDPEQEALQKKLSDRTYLKKKIEEALPSTSSGQGE